jgi:hypothetical protein
LRAYFDAGAAGRRRRRPGKLAESLNYWASNLDE